MFTSAKPIWIRGCAQELNCSAVFTASSALHNTTLRIAAYTFYRLYVDGTFAAFGPARTAEGYARIDEILLESGKELRIEVAGYHCRSLSTVIQSSFFAAELVDAVGNVLLTTANHGDFVCRRLAARVQAVERYSQQRHFGEVWDFSRSEDAAPICETEIVPAPVFLERTAPYPAYRDIPLTSALPGTFSYDETLPFRENRYSFSGSEYWGEFPKKSILHRPFLWIQRQALHTSMEPLSLPASLQAGESLLFDFGMLHCGFLTCAVTTAEDCEIVIGFTEYCEGGTFAFSGINAQNVISYRFPKGMTADVQSFEPYTARCAIVMVKSGALTLRAFGIKTFEHAMAGAYRPVLPEQTLQSIYDAALRTFAHNAVDLYTDCPSRERAGWLCDSYFTGAVEHFLFGASPVEDAFLENYRLFRSHPVVDPGMLPMCYPADTGHLEAEPYIPQWCMWYILEVRDYLLERNPTVDREQFRDSVTGIVQFLAKYENEDGLLEDLPGWNFVEWSDANSWVKNVNYPTNFLYAEVLRAYSALYGSAQDAEKADHICAVTIAQSFDGELFCDNAERRDGILVRTGNTSEAGQYYALLFGGINIDDERFARLKHHVLTGCRDVPTTGRCFVPVNAFIGLYLRMQTLLKLEYYELLLGELNDFFGGMVERTNTLWEYRQLRGSHDHGFASFVAPAMVYALRGLGKL